EAPNDSDNASAIVFIGDHWPRGNRPSTPRTGLSLDAAGSGLLAAARDALRLRGLLVRLGGFGSAGVTSAIVAGTGAGARSAGAGGIATGIGVGTASTIAATGTGASGSLVSLVAGAELRVDAATPPAPSNAPPAIASRMLARRDRGGGIVPGTTNVARSG